MSTMRRTIELIAKFMRVPPEVRDEISAAEYSDNELAIRAERRALIAELKTAPTRTDVMPEVKRLQAELKKELELARGFEAKYREHDLKARELSQQVYGHSLDALRGPSRVDELRAQLRASASPKIAKARGAFVRLLDEARAQGGRSEPVAGALRYDGRAAFERSSSHSVRRRVDAIAAALDALDALALQDVAESEIETRITALRDGFPGVTLEVITEEVA